MRLSRRKSKDPENTEAFSFENELGASEDEECAKDSEKTETFSFENELGASEDEEYTGSLNLFHNLTDKSQNDDFYKKSVLEKIWVRHTSISQQLLLLILRHYMLMLPHPRRRCLWIPPVNSAGRGICGC